MERQLIISVGREFGSDGHVIAENLARRFELPLYDYNLLEHIAEERDITHEELKRYDEKPKSRLFSRTVRGHSNSIQEHVAQMQFDYLRQMERDGRSFVIVGRCAETILKGNPGLVTIFILGDMECKVKRVMEKYGLSEREAQQMCKKEDWERKYYHNYFCPGQWGDSRNYDLSVNSSRLGLEKTADMLERFIRTRMQF